MRHISLLDSLATQKAIPKDVDHLVDVDDDMPLELWPGIRAPAGMPDDVREELLAPIRDDLPG